MRDTGEEERKESEKIKGQKNDHPRRSSKELLSTAPIQIKAFKSRENKIELIQP